MNDASQVGIVRPSYGALRRSLFPIYAADQLVFFAVAAFPFIWLASVNPRLALYAGFGAYGGALFSMQQSTPSSLLLDIPEETRMIELLDNSRLLKRSGNGLEWISRLGRLRRWSTDKIGLKRTPSGVLVTGRLRDLQIIARRMENDIRFRHIADTERTRQISLMDERSGVPNRGDEVDKLSSGELQSELQWSRIELSDQRKWRVFSALYLLSLAVFVGWLVLLLIGIVQPQAMAFENRIDLPIGLGSIICLEVFMRLARRAEKRLIAHASKS